MVKDFDTGIDVQSYNLWATTFEELVFLLQKLSSETPHMRNLFGTDGRSWKSKMLAPRLGVSNGKLSWNKWYWLIMINNVLIVVNNGYFGLSFWQMNVWNVSRRIIGALPLFEGHDSRWNDWHTHVNILHRYIIYNIYIYMICFAVQDELDMFHSVSRTIISWAYFRGMSCQPAVVMVFMWVHELHIHWISQKHVVICCNPCRCFCLTKTRPNETMMDVRN